MKRFQKDQKGFTLVELIVVLVILAILAAMLVPALLGYIDRAREGKYNEEIHAIYTATQAVADEQYAKGNTAVSINGNSTAISDINKLVDPTSVTSIAVSTGTSTDATPHGAWQIKGFNVSFKSQDGKNVTADFSDDGTINASWQ